MKTKNSKIGSWFKRAASLATMSVMMLGLTGNASARILFEDDTFFNVNSEGIILDFNNDVAGAAENISLQFGNDGTDASIDYAGDTGDVTLSTPGGDFDFSDDDITTTGALEFANSSEFHIREVADEAAATCTTVNEVVLDTTENAIYVCTVVGAPGTWTSSAAGADLQSSYDADAAGAHEIVVAAGGTNAVEIRANANGDDLFQLQNSAAANLLNIQDLGGTTLDLDSLIVDWDATGAFDLDSTAGVSVGAGAASDFTTTAGALTLDGAAGVNIAGNAAEVDVTTTGALDLNSGAFTWDGSTAALTSTSTFDIDSTGIVTVDSDAGVTVGGAGIGLTSDGGALALTGDGTNDIDLINAGAALDFDSATANITTTSTFDVDATGIVTIDSDAASNLSGAGVNVTSDGGALALTGDGTNDIDIANAGAALDIDSATIDLDTTSTFDINTSTWDITGAGVGSGFTGFTSTGDINFSGASSFRIHEGAANPGTCTEGQLFYNSSDNQVYVCTAANTWSNSGPQDFEDVYGIDADNTLTASGTFDIDAVGAVGIDSDAGVTIGGTTVGITADGGVLALTGDGTNDIDIANAGAALDFDSATANITTTSTFDVDATGIVTIDSDAAANLSGAGLNLTSDGGAVAITGDGTNDIDLSNAGAALDFDAASFDLLTTAAFSIDGTGASNVSATSGNLTLSTITTGDVAIGSADDVTITAGDDVIFDDAQLTGIVQLSDADTDWNAFFTSDGIVDNINQLAELNNEDLTFYPEYPDSVVHADGTNNRGTLESEYDTTQESNYYHWTTRRGATQDIDIRFQFALPTDFGTAGDFTFDYRTGTATEGDNDVEVRLYNVTNTTECGNDLTNGTANVWATGTITAATIAAGCTGGTALDAGDIVEVQIKLLDNSGAADFADIGRLIWAYTR